MLETEKIREIRSKDDEDARFGHKTPTSTFYWYKNHLAMTQDRLTAGISVTPGGDLDGKELPGLIEKAKENGIEVTEEIGDIAYVSEENLEAYGKESTLIARTNTAAAAQSELDKEVRFNKDAKMLQCSAGELAVRVEKRDAKKGNQYHNYIFSTRKLDCIHYKVREDGRILIRAAYVVLGVITEGYKDILSITVGANETSKFWLGMLNDLKNRGLRDVLFFCVDGLAGFKEAISAVYPHGQIQRCVIHILRNSFKL